MRHVDLCSGIGGFALGFEWAGLSSPVMFCDFEPWCQKVLAKNWPSVPIANDVKELASDPKGNVPDCDILTAGYPCQPFSLAGKRRGEADDRHIWPHILKIVAHKRPTWVVFENVYGHLSMGLDEVLSDLEAEGYTTRPFIVPACGVNAPHKRDRIWIVGYTENIGWDRRSEAARREGQTDQQEQSQPEIWSEPSRPSQDVADTSRQRLQGGERLREDGSENRKWRAWPNGSAAKRGNDRRRPTNQWDFEPNVGRVADGIPRRVDRLKGLGNAIVPQIAMNIGSVIKEMSK